VPVNVGRLRSPRNQGVLVALAGPGTNVVLAALAGLCFGLLHAQDTLTYALNTNQFSWVEIPFLLGLVNIMFALFNMIPIPPLDGSVLVERMLPRAWWPGYLRFRQYTMPLIMVLVLLNYYFNPGPITWLFNQVLTWWAGLFHITLVG
jgi:Zn-dependent protease